MLIKTLAEFEKCHWVKLLAIDTETSSLNPREAELTGFGWGDNKTQYYIDWETCNFKEEVIKKLKEFLKHIELFSIMPNLI